MSLYVSGRMERSLYTEKGMEIRDNGESHTSQFYPKMVKPNSVLYLRHMVEQGRKSDNWFEIICMNGLNSIVPVKTEFKLINFYVGCGLVVQFIRFFIKLFMKEFDHISDEWIREVCQGGFDNYLNILNGSVGSDMRKNYQGPGLTLLMYKEGGY